MHYNSVMEQEEFELDTRSPQEVTMHTAVLALTTVLSLTGNSLVCLAFYRNRRLRTVTNFYVLSLAIADLILAVVVGCSSTLASGLRRWPFHYNFCQFTGFVAALCMGSDINFHSGACVDKSLLLHCKGPKILDAV